MALHMLHLLGRKHIYFFTLIKGHRPNRGKQNIIEKKTYHQSNPKVSVTTRLSDQTQIFKRAPDIRIIFLSRIKGQKA